MNIYFIRSFLFDSTNPNVGNMELIKVFNNNAILALENGEEVVVTGAGIGFNLGTSRQVDETKVEKIYHLSKFEQEKYSDIFKGDKSCFDVANKIFQLAKEELNQDLYNEAILSLADHLYFLIQRIKNNEYIGFAVLDDLICVYPIEYRISLKAIDIIESDLNVQIPKEEAGFIAFHLVSSEKEGGNKNPYKLIQFVKEILKVIYVYYPQLKDYNESFVYSRLIIHLKFLGNRILRKENANSSEIGQIVKVFEKDENLQECVDAISDCIRKKYKWNLSDEEKVYIMIHLKRMESYKN